jgi:hypothetical protein
MTDDWTWFSVFLCPFSFTAAWSWLVWRCFSGKRSFCKRVWGDSKAAFWCLGKELWVLLQSVEAFVTGAGRGIIQGNGVLCWRRVRKDR